MAGVEDEQATQTDHGETDHAHAHDRPHPVAVQAGRVPGDRGAPVVAEQYDRLVQEHGEMLAADGGSQWQAIKAAAALAERLGPIEVLPPEDENAQLAAFTIEGAAAAR